jgi:P4 family phage/plasmid primase-like protien
MRDHVLKCSFVSSSNHFGDVEEYEGDFDELAAMLMTDAATIAGKEGRAVVMSSFRYGEGETELTRGLEGVFRQTHLIDETTLLGLDFDTRAGDPVEIAAPLMAGHDAVLYTSHSHGRKGEHPRWRIIVRLERHVTVEEYKLLWNWADSYLGGGSDKSCKDPTRLYFTPRIPADDATLPSLFRRSIGQGLDPDALPDGSSVGQMLADKRAKEDAIAAEAKARRMVARPSGAGPDKIERAMRWLDRAEPALQGSNGSGTAMRVIGTAVRGFNLSAGDARHALAAWNARCIPPWNEKDLEHKITDALKTPDPSGRASGWLLDAAPPPRAGSSIALAPSPPRREQGPAPSAPTTHVKLTDSGNAERWVQMYGENFRFERASGKWMKWGDGVWKRDADLEAAFTTKEVARSFALNADNASDADMAEALRKHSSKSEAKARRDAMLALAQQETGVAVDPAHLDTDPWILNVRNGTVDLKTGKLRKADRSDLCTKQSPVDYDENAQCPVFDAFLESSLPDVEVRSWLMRYLGYAITGVVHEHIFPVLWGLVGRNGKGTLIETVFGVLGDLAMPVPTELIIEGKHEVHPNMKAQLLGVRLAVAAEIKSRDRLAESTVKHLTGGDSIRARFLGQEFFTFSPSHKLVLQTNFKPRVSGGDPALWARMRVVPFTVSFAGREDVHLRTKLQAERSGILRRLVEGCLEWQRIGLGTAKAIEEATADYKADSDTLAAFCDEKLVFVKTARVSAGRLYKEFRLWSDERGEHPATQTAFGTEFRQACPTLRRIKIDGIAHYEGVGLKADETDRSVKGE